MARRTKAEDKALAALIVVGLVVGVPAYFIYSVGESVGWPTFIGGAAAILVAGFTISHLRQKAAERSRLERISARRAELLAKHGDAQIVDRIMNRQIWQGQTHEQLRDSIGSPIDTDEKVTKKYRRETWKYYQTGSNRFGLRITLEDGVVIGWDEKM